MAFNEDLAEKVRKALSSQKALEEKKMMGGLTFMVNDKMCLGVINDDLMARIDPEVYEESLERTGCRQMDFTGKPMKGYVFVDSSGTDRKKDFDHWVSLALEFNKKAKSSKKKKK
jgi:TfoX/Sxy family transcriptional regulator of competence genes